MNDKLPPHVPEAERAIIGCALADPNLAAELRPVWFFDLRHRAAAEALVGMASAYKSISAETLALELKGTGLDSPIALVSECMASCESPANFSYYRGRLADALTLRSIISVSQMAVAAAGERQANATEELECFERAALAIRQQRHGFDGAERSIKELLTELTFDYEQAAKNGKPAGIATGFYDLDKLLGGMKPGQFIVVAARPSVGKTSLALNIIERVAIDDQIPAGFFSLEMSKKECLHRLAASRARVDGTRLNNGAMTESERKRLTVANGQLVKASDRLPICDLGGLTLAQLTARARRMVQQSKIRLLIVDYLGLLRSGEKGRSRYEETTLVSNGLKALAKELDVPLIALAQLNRDTDRDGRAPRMSDLRDSGAIEQDADVVVLLHAEQPKGSEDPIVSAICPKIRNGCVGKVQLIFRRAFTRFESMSKVA
jgi:replicative DNA helicase